MRAIVATISPLLSSALQCILARQLSSLELIQVRNAEAFWSELRSDTPPDIALICFEPHSGFGFRFLETVHGEAPSIPLVVWNLSPDRSDAISVIRQGVSAYLGRHATPRHLLGAVRRSLAGQRFVSPEVAERLVLEMGDVTGSEEQPHLSSRETEVLRLLSLGLKRSEIARKLFLSPQTVSSYRAKIMEKLGATSTAHLVRWAIRHRLS